MAFPAWLSTILAGIPSAVSAISSAFSRTPKPREPAPPADHFDATDAAVDAELARRRAEEAAADTQRAVAPNGTGARVITLIPPKP